MPPTTEDIPAALAEQHDELAGVLGGLTDADWQRPTRCEGWTVANVVLHLAQTDELAIASLAGRYQQTIEAMGGGRTSSVTVDEGAAALVAREGDVPAPLIRQRWEREAAHLRSSLAAAEGHRRVHWVTGEVSVPTLATTRLAETWIHTGDVAEAVGVRLHPTERLRHIARLAWRTLPYAFDRAGRQLGGPVAFALRGPNGNAWEFLPGSDPSTVIRGEGAELCLVAARRLDPAGTSLSGTGPDADAVLELIRTYA